MRKLILGDELNPLPLVAVAGAFGAAGVVAWAGVSASSELFGPTVRHTASARQMALTFDDGPNPAVTPRLLDLLDRQSVRASFFLIGKFVRACPDLAGEIAARGHLIGNHTETHPNLFFRSRAGIRDELISCQDAIASATRGDLPRWMRPPFGYRNPLLDGEVQRAGFKGVVMWSRLCGDWNPQAPEKLVARLAHAAPPVQQRRASSRGEIVVLHDGDYRSLGGDRLYIIAALEYWLPRWRDAGTEFVTIEGSVARK